MMSIRFLPDLLNFLERIVFAMPGVEGTGATQLHLRDRAGG
jgi:hypothetical protein